MQADTDRDGQLWEERLGCTTRVDWLTEDTRTRLIDCNTCTWDLSGRNLNWINRYASLIIPQWRTLSRIALAASLSLETRFNVYLYNIGNSARESSKKLFLENVLIVYSKITRNSSTFDTVKVREISGIYFQEVLEIANSIFFIGKTL